MPMRQQPIFNPHLFMSLTYQIILFIPLFLSLGSQYMIKTNKLPTKEHTYISVTVKN